LETFFALPVAEWDRTAHITILPSNLFHKIYRENSQARKKRSGGRFEEKKPAVEERMLVVHRETQLVKI
jgi:hypothetical protein